MNTLNSTPIRGRMGTPTSSLFRNRSNLVTLKIGVQSPANVDQDGEKTESSLLFIANSPLPLSKVNKVTQFNSTLLIQSMLTMLCESKTKTPLEARQLFNNLYCYLQQINMVFPVDNQDERLLSIGRKYFTQVSNIFSILISNSVSSLKPFTLSAQDIDFIYSAITNSAPYSLIPSRSLNMLNVEESRFLSVSRYESEYEQQQKLGCGGFGVVYKVRNRNDFMEYAVKIIRHQSLVLRELKKVQQEVQHLAKLKHPNIVAYYSSWMEHGLSTFRIDESKLSSCQSSLKITDITMDSEREVSENVEDDGIVFESNSQPLSSLSVSNVAIPKGKFSDDSSPETASESLEKSQVSSRTNETDAPSEGVTLYIQMELCHSNLDQFLLDRNRNLDGLEGEEAFERIDGDTCQSYMSQILTAVEFIHSKGLIHRDLKPSNIFLDEQCKIVRIGDFGLARSIHSDQEPLTPFDSYTEAKYTAQIGTGTYAAPEQLKTSNYDQKADMYSIGIIYFELYCPFDTMERARAIYDLREKQGHAKQLDGIRKRFPLVAERVVSLLSEDPAKRPSASELLKLQVNPADLVKELENQLTQKNAYIESLCQRLSKQEVYIGYLNRQMKLLKSRLYQRNK